MTEGADPTLLLRMRDLCAYKGLSNLTAKDSVSKCHSPWSQMGLCKVRACMWTWMLWEAGPPLC